MVDLELLEIYTVANPLSICLAFVFCSLAGSFLNVVIYRTPLERSVVLPPSACTTCGVPLRWWQNIPILSYLSLGGRCHFCSSSYSSRYAWLELFVASVGAGMFWFYGGLAWQFIYHFTFFCLCTAVFFTDLDHWIIPDEVNLFGVLFGCSLAYFMPVRGDMELLAYPLAPGVQNLVSSILGVGCGLAFFWAIQVIGLMLAKQEAMGGGDVKFAALIGAFLGWRMGFVAFMGSFLLGAFVAVPMMLFGGRGKDPIPFGTFMALSAVPCALWGDRLLAEWLMTYY
ncbi:MAG: A24 family peptidase [Vulcanimicrobiota bacterium]